MPIETIEHERILVEPQTLLSWTQVCRKGWEEFVQRKRNGLTEHMKQQLLQEFNSMKEVVHHLIPEEPVRVENQAIVYDPVKMELNKIYSVEIRGKLHLVRKMQENVVETYELELME